MKEKCKLRRKLYSIRRGEDTPKKTRNGQPDEITTSSRSISILMDKNMMLKWLKTGSSRVNNSGFRPGSSSEKPFKPNHQFLAMGALLEIGIGLGLTWFRNPWTDLLRSVK
jgi:hypothetical protein